MMYVRTQRGYSLIEMIVAVALFSLVMLLATGALIKFMSLERVARYTNDVTTNLSFAVDSMSRSIRTGTNYKCGGSGTNCWPTPMNSLTFTDDQGRTVTYKLKSDGSLGRCTVGNCGIEANVIGLTDKRITIKSLRFYVKGVGSANVGGDSHITQPQVLISMQGEMKPDSNRPPVSFTIQTLATQRLLELPDAP